MIQRPHSPDMAVVHPVRVPNVDVPAESTIRPGGWAVRGADGREVDESGSAIPCH